MLHRDRDAAAARVDEFLAEEEFVTVLFRVTVFALAGEVEILAAPTPNSSDPSRRGEAGLQGQTPILPPVESGGPSSRAPAASTDIAAGTLARMPLWLAEPLAISGFVEIQTPAIFGPKVMKEFKGGQQDAMVPNLKAKSDYYYNVGMKVSSLSGREGARTKKSVLGLFQQRYTGVLHAADSKGHDLEEAVEKFDSLETRLCQRTIHDKRSWKEWRTNLNQ
jgi:hypothetical protein